MNHSRDFKLLRHTFADSILVGIFALEVLLKFGAAIGVIRLSLFFSLLLIVFLIWLYYFNQIVTSHEFIHTPFFEHDWINTGLQVVISVSLIFPLSVLKHEHTLHHRFNNDRKDDRGRTNDPTSTYLNGENGYQELMFRYCFLSYFRMFSRSALADVHHGVVTGRYGRLVRYELAAIFVAVVGIIALGGVSGFVAYWLVPMWLGWFLTDMQNFYEHNRATDLNNWYANSTSYYGKIYNWYMFNQGYHQEHHVKPGVHWSKRPALREEIQDQLDEADAYVSNWPFLLGFFDPESRRRESRLSGS